MASRKRSLLPSSDEHELSETVMKRRRLNAVDESLVIAQSAWPVPIQEIITECIELNEDKIVIMCEEATDAQYPFGQNFGEINFRVGYEQYPNAYALCTIKGIFDERFKRVDIRNPDSMYGFNETDFKLEELGYFELGAYDHKECVIRQMVQKAVIRVTDFVFSHKQNIYNTVKIEDYVVKSLELKTSHFSAKYDVFDVKGSYYVLRKATVPNIFSDRSMKEYIYPCTLLLKKKKDWVCKEEDFQKEVVVQKEQMDYVIPHLCRACGVNPKLVPSVIVKKIHYYQEVNPVDTLQFDRKCLIIEDFGQTYVVFDMPATILSQANWGDICFKLKIDGVVITGDKFYFGKHEDDWDYRIGKYGGGQNPMDYHIDATQAHQYFYLGTRSQSWNDIYGYTEFEEKIKRGHFKIANETNIDYLDEFLKRVTGQEM